MCFSVLVSVCPLCILLFFVLSCREIVHQTGCFGISWFFAHQCVLCRTFSVRTSSVCFYPLPALSLLSPLGLSMFIYPLFCRNALGMTTCQGLDPTTSTALKNVGREPGVTPPTPTTTTSKYSLSSCDKVEV